LEIIDPYKIIKKDIKYETPLGVKLKEYHDKHGCYNDGDIFDIVYC
jgi:hypothetical protein